MLSDIEREVVILKAINELIDSIVNFEVLMKFGDTDPTEVRFKTASHAKFFNIVLVDLLSATDKKGLVEPEPYLAALRAITRAPNFNFDNSVGLLREVTSQFVSWLETSITIEKVWLPTVSIATDLRLTRFQLVKNAGNICRHNFLRAAGIAEDVRLLLQKNDVSITLDQALLALADLYEWFHNDVFLYHSSTIAEFLNNIRWGIYEYLRPEFQRSIVWEDSGPDRYRYRFTYPSGMTSNFAKDCYWNLMNDVRSPPYMKRFEVTEWLKKRY